MPAVAGDPPRGPVPNSRAIIPAFLPILMHGASQPLVNMQGFASSAYIVFHLGPFQNSFAALDVFTVYRKIQGILAQLLWGGLGTPYFTMDYCSSLLISFAIFFDGSSCNYLLLASFASHFLGMLLWLLFDPLLVDFELAI